MSDHALDLKLSDPDFLDRIATGLEAVKVRPKGDTASAISAAQEATRQFRDRALRLRAIARKLRETKPT